MAVAKVILNGTTLIDTTQKTVTAGSMLNGVTALKNDGTDITGSIASKTSSDLTASGDTVTAPAGYYASSASKAVASGSAGTPTATKGTVTNHSVSVTPSVTNTTGYITGGTKSGTAVTVFASELVSGTKSITSSGTTDVTNYASASVQAGTEGTPTATKSAVNNHSVTVTPSVTNTGGFISGTTKTGTAVTITAAELESGTKSITENGTGIDVTNYSSVDVSVSGGGVSTASVTILTSGYYELILPPSASQSGNTVTLPTDAIFVIIFYDMLGRARTTGTVTRSIYGDETVFVSVCPGQDGGTITLETM